MTLSQRSTRPLRLTPYAWAKLLRLRDLGDTEVGAFGVSAANDLLLVEDVCLVSQFCTAVTVRFLDESVADYFDRQVDAGLAPERFARIWIHTHPGNSPSPSGTDEETFARCFGLSDWSVMFILARGGQTYARLRFSAGPGGAVLLPVEIDFGRPFAGSDWASWDNEFAQSVVSEDAVFRTKRRNLLAPKAASTERQETSDEERSLAPWHEDPWWLTGDLFHDPFREIDDEYNGLDDRSFEFHGATL